MSRATHCARGSFRRGIGLRFTVAVILSLAALSISAQRGYASFTGANIQVDVSSSLGTGSFALNVPITGDSFTWDSPDGWSQEVWGSGHLLGTITDLKVTLDGDPNASVFFGVMAGAAPTNFNISSALVGFGAIPGAIGSASGGVTVTDTSGNGATLVGNYAGNTLSYQAEYNNGIVFANLVGNAAAPGVTATQSGSLSNVPIGPPVFNIQSKFSFVLSPNDVGSGTGNFSITPEPSSICLAAVGAAGLAFFARRRRKA